MRTAALLALLACSTACGGGDDLASPGSLVQEFGPRMRPGENCLGCHVDNPTRSDATSPEGRKATPWTAAGTVFAGPTSTQGLAGARLIFVGQNDEEVTVVSNEVGNFYTATPIKTSVGPRIEFEGRTAKMSKALPDVPACNACHDVPPIGGAPGRIYVP